VSVKLSQVAYRQFKELLLTGRIKSGSVLSQAELVRLVGVPISPLREALQVLEAEGLLSIEPRSGIRIVKPDFEMIKNAYQLRRMIEREAVIRFTSTCSSADLDAWERRHLDLRAAVEGGLDQPALGERIHSVDRAFHEAVVASLRNPLIDETYHRNMERLVLIRLDRAESLTPLLVKLSMREHLDVIAAMTRHDSERAAAAMDEHLTVTMHRAMGI
jgi:DNA-binding GntR family transcriptional regulator